MGPGMAWRAGAPCGGWTTWADGAGGAAASPAAVKQTKAVQAATCRIYAFLLVQRRNFHIHLLLARIAHAELLIFLLNGLDLRRDALHLQHRFHLRNAQRQQGQIDDQSLNDDGPAPVGQHVIVSPFQPKEQRPRDDAKETKIHQPAQILLCARDRRYVD